MHSHSCGFRRRDVARYVSADDEGKRESRSWRNVSSYSRILYLQPVYIEYFGGEDLDRYSVSLVN
jgi:hypothetical protein